MPLLRRTATWLLLTIALSVGRVHVTVAHPLRRALCGEWRWWMALSSPLLFAIWGATRILLIMLIDLSLSLNPAHQGQSHDQPA
jgi:hypothetical protein